MQMSEQIMTKLRRDLLQADLLWQKRRRKINTTCIFNDLCSAAATKRGLRHVVHKQDSDYTPEALGQARVKLPQHVFAQINRSLQDVKYRISGEKQSPRIFAIDGSKVHVHPCFMKHGYTTRTNNVPVSRPAIRPLAMLSSMLDVHSRTCYDAQITSHFNERTSALAHMDAARPQDTLIFDRGYYSRDLLQAATSRGLKVVFRLKKTAFKGAATFWNSSKTRAVVPVSNQDGSCTLVLLVKYFIEGKKYMNLVNFQASTSEIKELYALRWRVETSFKRLKSYLNLEDSHSMCPSLYVQEIEARILLDTLTMQLQTLRVYALRAQKTDFGEKESHTKQLRAITMSYFKVLDDFLNILFVLKSASLSRLNYKQFKRLWSSFDPGPCLKRPGG